ncbi:MAG: aminotransferase class I/II-fold pyridoxal phosphate-dependent enzyme [Eubacterium sp.]|nr:aminotransferase class I/II-fold pyridoxal phosphate-dependent enzyme [Eubacterium sp.]
MKDIKEKINEWKIYEENKQYKENEQYEENELKMKLHNENAYQYDDMLGKLEAYSKENIVPMHMPGAKRNSELIGRYMDDMPAPYDIDITEIDGFDNMHNADGMIKKAFEKTAVLYGADESLFLVNGSTAGNMAAICGVTDKGDSIIVARNCHISVYNAIILNELDANYVYPQYDDEYGYYKGISLREIKDTVEKNESMGKDIKAVVITSPTYEGNVSDIKNIAAYLHEHNIPLIVDEAHGAHFKFSCEFPQTAVEQGADIVINSVHKTLPSLTQTAVMHINYGYVNVSKVKRYWNIYQSTSPSYILMGSIDRCMSIIEKDGEYLFENYISKLKILRNKLGQLKNIKLIDSDDISKIVIGCDNAKILYDILLNEYGIQLEMSSLKYAIAMTSIFDSAEYYDRFYNALCEIDRRYNANNINNSANNNQNYVERYNIFNNTSSIKKADIKVNIADFKNEALMSIAKALNEGDKNGYDKIMMNDSSLYGRISAKMVYVYPPGIPILCPGEIISENVVNIISKAIDNGLEVVGLELDGLEYPYINDNINDDLKYNSEDNLKNSLKNNLKDSRNDKNTKNEGCKGAFVCLK